MDKQQRFLCCKLLHAFRALVSDVQLCPRFDSVDHEVLGQEPRDHAQTVES
jgi:hypothetical protein